MSKAISKAINNLLRNNKIQQTKLIDNNTDMIFPKLTKRERAITSLVFRGAKNKAIAVQLHISPNKEKNLYSIFRKTSSQNRIELISRTQSYIATLN